MGGFSLPGMGTGANAPNPCSGGSNLPCTSTANCQSPCAMGEFMITAPNMECTAAGLCAASTFNVQGSMNAIKFGTADAAYGSTFNIQGYVREITCDVGFCAGVSFNFIGGDYGDIKCEEYGGCGAGCTACQGGVCQPCDNVEITVTSNARSMADAVPGALPARAECASRATMCPRRRLKLAIDLYLSISIISINFNFLLTFFIPFQK